MVLAFAGDSTTTTSILRAIPLGAKQRLDARLMIFRQEPVKWLRFALAVKPSMDFA